MTNGNQAKQIREKKLKEGQKKEPSSQLKANEKSMSIVCTVCRQPFMCTVKQPELAQHAENKHKKTVADCFPTFQAP
jgi:hypothetical protein